MPLTTWLPKAARLLGCRPSAQGKKNRTATRLRCSLWLEPLEARDVPAFGPTEQAATLFDLVNRMRTDPQGELMRILTSLSPIQSDDPHVQASLDQYQVNGTALAEIWGSLKPVAPLAWSDNLAAAAAFHNSYMIAYDQQSHQLPGEPSLAERVQNAGYIDWTALGENIFAFAQSVFHAHAAFVIDWGYGPDGLQQPPEHRLNIMNPEFTEFGMAISPEVDDNTQVGPFVITQNFGARQDTSYVFGNLVMPAKNGGSSSTGGSSSPLQLFIQGADLATSCELSSTGFFQLAVNPGVYTLTFAGGNLEAPVVRHVVVGDSNVWMKVDPSIASNGNHAPVLTGYLANPGISILEDAANPWGIPVSQILGNAYFDEDGPGQGGIAVYHASHADRGAWQFSTDFGQSWGDLEGVSLLTARLLHANSLVRFLPDPNFHGTVQLSYRAWDGTAGVSGSSANIHLVGDSSSISLDAGNFTVTVQSVNDAPVLNPQSMPEMTPATSRGINPSAIRVADLLTDSVVDHDADALQGIAIFGNTGGAIGTWQFSLDGGNTWSNLGPNTASGARLLRAEDWIRFEPRFAQTGKATLTYRAWDQTAGIAGERINLQAVDVPPDESAFSADWSKVCVFVNNAPELRAGTTPLLTTIWEDTTFPAGDNVGRFAASLIDDPDANQIRGIAVVGLGGSENGRWQYCIDGRSWVNFGDASTDQAMLLRGRDKVRFIPNPDYFGSATLRFHAWDGTQGVPGARLDLSSSERLGGGSAFSVDSTEAILAIAPVNDAPILDPNGNPTLTPVEMNAINPKGDYVARLTELVVSDPDPDSQRGIAIIGISGPNKGTWQYSTNDGQSWITIRNVSGSQALLLRDVDRLRFIPNRNFRGQASLMFRAWDQTSGAFGEVADLSMIQSVGGITAFSSGTLQGFVDVE